MNDTCSQVSLSNREAYFMSLGCLDIYEHRESSQDVALYRASPPKQLLTGTGWRESKVLSLLFTSPFL